MKKSDLVRGVVGLALSLAVVYGYVFIAGRSWKESQK